MLESGNSPLTLVTDFLSIIHTLLHVEQCIQLGTTLQKVCGVHYMCTKALRVLTQRATVRGATQGNARGTQPKAM